MGATVAVNGKVTLFTADIEMDISLFDNKRVLYM
jgi:hypothetical protein